MTWQSPPIIQSIMGGRIIELQEAILAIWTALDGSNAGLLDGTDLDEAIYAAVDLLPDEMRGRLPAAKIAKPKRDQFEDLLG